MSYSFDNYLKFKSILDPVLPSIPEGKEALFGRFTSHLDTHKSIQDDIQYLYKSFLKFSGHKINEKNVFYFFKGAKTTFDHPIRLKKVPSDLIDLLEKKPSFVEIHSVSWSLPDMHHIAVPTDMGLIVQSAYYKCKYGIDITVTGSKRSLINQLGLIKDAPLGSSFGFIVSDIRQTLTSHVTPIIVFKKSHERFQVLNLDSLKNPHSIFKKVLHKLMDRGIKIDYITTKHKRLLNTYHDRIEAIQILKDTLVWFKEQKIDCLIGFLNAKRKSDSYKFQFDLPARMLKTTEYLPNIISNFYSNCSHKQFETLKDFKEKWRLRATKYEAFKIFYPKDACLKSEMIECEQDYLVDLFLNFKSKINHHKLIDHLKDSRIIELALSKGMIYSA